MFEEEQHKKEMEYKQTQIDEQEKDYQELINRNRMTIEQIEEDRDNELTEIQKKNEDNKSQVHDMALKSKAELQLIKNKMKDIEDDKKTLERQLLDQGFAVMKQEKFHKEHLDDIKTLLKQIQEKDTQIGERETKIYQLKRKTQELEKFKFVLDFKIKELRRDIAPREQEIFNLRIKTKEMDKELKKYNTINASLGFMVDDLRTRQETMQEVIKRNRDEIRNNNMYINGFKNAVHAVVPHIDTQESLQKAVWTHLGKYIQDQQAKEKNDDPEIKKEYDN